MNRRNFFLGMIGCAAAPVAAALPKGTTLVIKGLKPSEIFTGRQIREVFAQMEREGRLAPRDKMA